MASRAESGSRRTGALTAGMEIASVLYPGSAVVDTLLAVPTLMLLLILVNIFAANLLTIILLLSVLSWLGTARLVSGEVLALRVRDYVQAAKTVGGGSSAVTWCRTRSA